MSEQENPKKKKWFIQNLPTAIWIVFIVFGSRYINYLEQWVPYKNKIVLGGVLLLLANVSYFIPSERNWITEKVGSRILSWLLFNVIAASAIAVFIIIFYLLANLFGKLPEAVSSIFTVILFVIGIFYLIGLGFYLLEKADKN